MVQFYGGQAASRVGSRRAGPGGGSSRWCLGRAPPFAHPPPPLGLGPCNAESVARHRNRQIIHRLNALQEFRYLDWLFHVRRWGVRSGVVGVHTGGRAQGWAWGVKNGGTDQWGRCFWREEGRVLKEIKCGVGNHSTAKKLARRRGRMDIQQHALFCFAFALLAVPFKVEKRGAGPRIVVHYKNNSLKPMPPRRQTLPKLVHIVSIFRKVHIDSNRAAAPAQTHGGGRAPARIHGGGPQR
jgi:hypothetical protein